MNEEFDLVIERDSKGYYVASVPAPCGCHTQARSLDELMIRVREAIRLPFLPRLQKAITSCVSVDGPSSDLAACNVILQSSGGQKAMNAMFLLGLFSYSGFPRSEKWYSLL